MESFIGQILLVAFNYAPQDYLPCDGRTLNIPQYQGLYAVIGNKYGGNVQDKTFALPNLAGKSPDPTMFYIICVNGLFPVRPD